MTTTFHDSNRWTFLTASTETINTVTRNFGFKFKTEEGLFTHNFLTVVLDAKGFMQAGWPIGGDTSDNLVQEITKARHLANVEPNRPQVSHACQEAGGAFQTPNLPGGLGYSSKLAAWFACEPESFLPFLPPAIDRRST